MRRIDHSNIYQLAYEMPNTGKKFAEFCISHARMRRGSADITIVEEDKSSFRVFLRSKKASFIAIIQGRSRKGCSDKNGPHIDEEEVLRCLDAVIEIEDRDRSMTNSSAIAEPTSSPTTDAATSHAFFRGKADSSDHKKSHSRDVKYDTIKGFDSFMLY